MQKLCDKVPSYDSAVAMQVINDELGRPWQEIYSELRCGVAGSRLGAGLRAA
jgi:aarF domain-containing kinase